MNAEPKYKQIVDYIKQQISDGAYSSTTKLPTEQALAKQFKVSRPTVVKAMEKLRDLGFVSRIQGSGTYVNAPKSASVSLNTNIISVILPFAEYRNTNRIDELNILKGIEQQLSQNGYFTMIHYCQDSSADFIETFKSVKNSLSVGIIAYVAQDMTSCTEMYDLFFDNKPLVLMDQPIIGMNFPCIRSDNQKGASIATQHLIDCGYQSIHYLSDVNFNFNESIRERYIGFCQCVQNNLTHAEFNHAFLHSHPDQNEIKDTIEQIILKNRGKRIGFFCTGDYFAQKVYNVCLSLGCKIPQNVGIIGFDGLSVPLKSHSQLSTISQSFFEIGKRASTTVLRWISTGTMPFDGHKTEVRLVLGDTTSQ